MIASCTCGKRGNSGDRVRLYVIITPMKERQEYLCWECVSEFKNKYASHPKFQIKDKADMK